MDSLPILEPMLLVSSGQLSFAFYYPPFSSAWVAQGDGTKKPTVREDEVSSKATEARAPGVEEASLMETKNIQLRET